MNILKKYEDIALSNYDILELLDDKVNIVLYPNLYKYNNIDEVLGPHGAAILLFEAKPRYGHWVCLMKRENVIEFFNSYGGIRLGFPDESLKHIPENYRKKSNQDIPILSLMLLESPYDLEYNEFNFQKKSSKVKTCGRHTVVRLLLKDLDIYQYKEFLDMLCEEFDLDYDELVTMLTI